MEPFGTISALNSRIRSKGKVVGMICFETKETGRVWTREEQDFAMSVSSILSLAIEVAQKKQAEEELRIRNEQVIKQQATLLKLSKIKHTKLESIFKTITMESSAPINSDRTSIWLFNKDRTNINCKDMYHLKKDLHTSGHTYQGSDISKYFDTIFSDKALIINEAEKDPLTKEYTEKFLIPFGSSAALMSRIRIKGEIVGLICFESTNPSKTGWTPEEYDFAISVSSFIATAMESFERMKAETEIKNSLKEKELLLKEIHHRVKNNLQVITSLLYLQSKNIKDKEQADVFLECQSRVKTMVLVHEKLYQSVDIARIDYAEYIKSLTGYLIHTYLSKDNPIQVNINVNNVFLTLDTAINCGLIINELFSNALKYAFTGRPEGSIDIQLYTNNSEDYTLIIQDDGIGISKTLDIRNTETLGLQLVMILVDQLEGTVSLDNSNGAKFTINFSEKNPS